MTLVRTYVIAWFHHRVSLLQSMTPVTTCNDPATETLAVHNMSNIRNNENAFSEGAL